MRAALVRIGRTAMVLLPVACLLAGGGALAQPIEADAEQVEADTVPAEADTASLEADAAEEATELDEAEPADHESVENITVTATKRATDVQQVPISVTAIGAETIRDAGITEFVQLQRFVPNLQIRPTTDTNSTSVRIRGIGSVGTNAGIDPSVGVFIDGVYQGRAGMSVGDLLDIERVEVLRGPQGTLFGKNTAAGAINVHTKRPSYDYETFLEGVLGNYDDMQFRGSTNVPLVDDRLAVRLSGYKVVRDGFDINRLDNERVNEANQYGVRGKLLWDATDTLSFELIGDYAQQNTRSFVADIIDYEASGPSLSGIPFAALVNATGIPLPMADPFDQVVGANVAPKNIVDVGGVALDSRLGLGDYELRWLNAWRTYSSDSRFDGDFSEYDAVLAFQDVGLDQVSSELTLVSPRSDLFDYQAGLFLFWMDMHTSDRNGWEQGLVNAAAGVGPLPSLIFTSAVNNVNENDHETLNVAGYGEGTLHLLEHFELTGGLRVTWEQKERAGISQTTPPPPPGLDAPPIIGPTIVRDEQRSVTNVQGRVVFAWKPTDEAMLYTSFANGFKSGGFNQLRVASGVSSEFDDEQSLTYELGTRTQWLRRSVTANVTGYFTDYDDFQAQSFDGASITVRNAGRLFSYGFEAELNWQPEPVDNLVLGVQAGLNIAEYDTFLGAENTVANQVALGETQPVPPFVPYIPALVGCINVDCTQNLSGKVLDNAPRWTTTAFASYERPVPRQPVLWFTRADYTYTSEFYLAQDLDPNLLQPGYHLLNLRAGLRAESLLWELTLWVTNVSDSDYLVAGLDVPIVSGYAGFKAPPRQYGGTVRIRF